MNPVKKSGEKPARAKPRRKRPVAFSGAPLLFVLASMALALSLVALGLIFFGTQIRHFADRAMSHRIAVTTPHTAVAPHKPHVPATKAVSGNGNGKGNGNGARSDLPFEEHLPVKPDPSAALAGAHEVRGKVEQPPRDVVSSLANGDAGPAPNRTDRPPMMVVVIDDLGDHPVFAKNLTELPFPVTMAILPNRPRTRFVASLAAEHGLEVILHQPMQPGSYPRTNPGPGALFTDMDAERVKAQLAENLAQLPQAIGINNHMGSAFTEDVPGMAAVMSVLKAKGLFFLDSVTSATSAAPQAAHQAGVPLYRRAVFLDNVRNTRTILGQLKTAERLALKNGRAIAIGHPYGETLDALKAWAHEHDGRIRIVTLTELGPES
jgi:polysaccharide deacetylase 2 family uncharacterized protein YibQ